MALPDPPSHDWINIGSFSRLVIGADTSPPDQTDVSRFSLWVADPGQTPRLLGVFDADKLESIRQQVANINVTSEKIERLSWRPFRDANEYAEAYGWGRYSQAAGLTAAAEFDRLIVEGCGNPNGHCMHGNAYPESKPDVAGYTKPGPGYVVAGDLGYATTIKREADNPRIGRNERCPCCGKKRKRCPFRKSS